MVCFHAQQALEKSLKAMLFERQMGCFETHDLERLAGLLAAERVELPCTLDEPCTAWYSSPRLWSS
jgi:HEPN domain-containing protein